MSVEVLAIVISAAGLLLSFVGAIGWSVRHMEAQSNRTEQRLGNRIDGIENRFDQRIDGLENSIDKRIDKLSARIDSVEESIVGVQRELVEVKVGLARLEGPPRQMLAAR